jgi:hypothetical protein
MSKKHALAVRGKKHKPYRMRISRLTVDKLGVRLYDKVSAAIAELVANSYDADAKEVIVKAPMDKMLATVQDGKLQDKGYTIEVIDDGIGMTPEEVNEFYLIVGSERRGDVRRGEKSKIFERKVMGRKGVGKLAPFGICEEIEVITSGGDPVQGVDENGKSAVGYWTAHLKLDRNKILEPTDYDYPPKVGALDGIVREKPGTHVILRRFSRRAVPSMDEFERQLSQRFGVEAPNWKIVLVDALKTKGQKEYSRTVRGFNRNIVLMPHTRISFPAKSTSSIDVKLLKGHHDALDPDGKPYKDLKAGFEHEGKFYPISGWVAYAKEPYKDDLMAGVRIYCRGKIAAQTLIFNRGAGFTGEYDIRSYLIGELEADWLDEEEDLIQTDRRDILWSHEIGQVFEKWGRRVVTEIGRLSRDPLKKKSWELFQDASDINTRVRNEYPAKDQEEIRKNALFVAKSLGETIRPGELKDTDLIDSFVRLSLTVAPIFTLDKELRKAAKSTESSLAVVASILKTARVAELATFGRIAEDRVKVIETVEKLKDDPKSLEAALQKTIAEAPWLINPQWSPVSANRDFTTLKEEFRKFYKEKTGKEIKLQDFTETNKRADFVLTTQRGYIEIVEIKRPKHKLENEEMDRINTYADLMDEFLNLPGHADFKEAFKGFHVTLVCDRLNLSGIHKKAFDGMKGDGVLDHITWAVFLGRTKRVHQDFLKEAERQKRNA